jgi:hypothetical protein
MNNSGKTEYKYSKRQVKKRRKESMDPNVIHDYKFTFADEYYETLQDEYKKDYLEDEKDEGPRQ